jgi:hypothetical protein
MSMRILFKKKLKNMKWKFKDSKYSWNNRENYSNKMFLGLKMKEIFWKKTFLT